MSKSSKLYLSVIVPAYNEAERIPAALLDMDKRLRTMDFGAGSYELIVVNDGSSDKTLETVRELAPRLKNFKILDLGRNQGKGAAVRAGMLAAKGTIRIFSDADNSTSIDQFAAMMPFFESGYDVVIGSRAVAGAKLEPAEPWYRGLVGKGLNLVIQALLLPGIRDTQCGFKAFTTEAAERVFSISKINGWGFDFEVLSLAKNFGYRIKEIPVRWVNDVRSHMKLSGGIQFLRDIGKVKWWFSSNAYTRDSRGPDIIILAAGKGSRMKSKIPKPLQAVAGKPAIVRIVENIAPLCSKPIVVIGNNSKAIIEALGDHHAYVVQKSQQGTGHAILEVKRALAATLKNHALSENVIVIPGDHPLVTSETLREIFYSHEKKNALITIATNIIPNFDGDYKMFFHNGRIKRNHDGRVAAIVEEKDANKDEKNIKEVNASYYCFNTKWLFENIEKLDTNNASAEFYLTDIVKLAVKSGIPINSYTLTDTREGMGFNTPEELATLNRVAKILKKD
jgi:dolichyl-phosphate beta-glucosyltransferase